MHKKIILSLFIASTILYAVFWLVFQATAATLDVCPIGCTYSTIQNAVDNAMPFDLIDVSAGTYAENLVIDKSITIQGDAATNTIVDGTDTDSVFIITGTIAVTLTNMTITNGNTTSSGLGGGLRIEQADVTIVDVIVSDNSAWNSGGGVYSIGGDITILDSQIVSNIVSTSGSALGGGISVSDDESKPSQVSIVNTAVISNVAFSSSGSATGGGINSTASMLVIENSTVSGNESSEAAGGIFISGSDGGPTKTAAITNSTLSGNSSSFTGGGVYATNSAEVTMTNSTIVSNTAQFFAGGIAAFDDSAVNLENVLIAFNSPTDCDALGDFIHSKDHNLDSDNSCSLTKANDLPATLPLIDTLQDNGGLTYSHALLENSPAINAGSNAVCPTKDQRGVIRPQGIACDIGAYEFVEESTFIEFIYLPMIAKE